MSKASFKSANRICPVFSLHR
uniref:Uncharacterized protein n=1 Tax=Rhizophora mucronata TaxID=61149 RepID=A0A2P2QT16_RHIMU